MEADQDPFVEENSLFCVAHAVYILEVVSGSDSGSVHFLTIFAQVTLDEFIDGVLRCKGPARAVDQAECPCDGTRRGSGW